MRNFRLYLLGLGLVVAVVSSIWSGMQNAHAVFNDLTICAGVTEIPESECQALLAIYNATDGDNWTSTKNWGNTGMVCSRFGVKCTNNQVGSLSFSKNNLSGIIPAEISILTGLTSIDLGTNTISSLPESMSGLALTYLDISSNSFSSFPSVIISLTGLQTLHAESNGFSKWPKNFSNLQQLQQLYLDHNNFTDIAGDISTGLIILSMESNQISSIPVSLLSMSQLTTLKLKDNVITLLEESLSGLVSLIDGGSTISNNLFTTKGYSQEFSDWMGLKFPDWTTQQVPQTAIDYDLEVSSQRLDEYVNNDSLLRYQIYYYNNGAQSQDNVTVSTTLSPYVSLLSSSLGYDNSSYYNTRFGTSGDACFLDMLNETGIYMEVLDLWAQGYGVTGIYDFLFMVPAMVDSFTAPPYNGERSQVGEFFRDFISTAGSLSTEHPEYGALWNVFQDTIGVDVRAYPECGEAPSYTYIRNIGTLGSHIGGYITLSTKTSSPLSSSTESLGSVSGEVNTLSFSTGKNTLDGPMTFSRTNESTTGEAMIFLNKNGGPILYNNDYILASVLHDGMTDQEKAVALRQLVKDYTYNYGYPLYVNTRSQKDDYTNPVHMLNTLYGMCGEINSTLASLARIAGLSSRMVGLEGHITTEIMISGARAFFDADGGVYRTGDDGHILSIDELIADPNIIRNNPQNNGYDTEGYIEMIVSTGDNTFNDYTFDHPNNAGMAFTLYPHDTIAYRYSYLGTDNQNGQKDYGEGIVTRILNPNYAITDITDTSFTFTEKFPYLIGAMEVSVTTGFSDTVGVYLSISGANDIYLGNLHQRLSYMINGSTREDNYYSYTLRFVCENTCDVQTIIPLIQVKNTFIFNTIALPYSGSLDLYVLNTGELFENISVQAEYNLQNRISVTTTITGGSEDTIPMNNIETLSPAKYTEPPSSDVQVSTKWLSNYVDNTTAVGYQIHYYNNGTTPGENTRITTTLPPNMELISSDVPYSATGVFNTSFGTSDDPCLVDLLNETGIYMDIANQWLIDNDLPDLQTFFMSAPRIASIFSVAPFSGQANQVGDFLLKLSTIGIRDYSVYGSFRYLFRDLFDVDLRQYPSCGARPSPLYGWDLGDLGSHIGGDINLLLRPLGTAIQDAHDLGTFDQFSNTVSVPTNKTTESGSVSFSWTNTSSGGAASIFFNKHGGPIMYDNQSIIDSIITDGMTDQEKVIAARQLVKDYTFNYGFLDRFSPDTLWGADANNPVHGLGTLYGNCGHINGVLGGLIELLGFDTRWVGLEGHVVMEVLLSGQRSMLDADGGVYWTGDDGHIYSADELIANPDIIRNNPQHNRYDTETYIDFYVTTGNNTTGLHNVAFSNDQNMALTLFPKDTISYTYDYVGTEDYANNGQENNGTMEITRKLSPYHDIENQTDTSFTYNENLPYLIMDMEISSDVPLTGIVKVYITIGKLDEVFLGNLHQRMGTRINVVDRLDDYYGYSLRFVCQSACDTTGIINHLTIKNIAPFNTPPLPYNSGSLDLYILGSGGNFQNITGKALYRAPGVTQITTNISSYIDEVDMLNNIQSLSLDVLSVTGSNHSTGSSHSTGPITYPIFLVQDSCPNGDFSASLYDGICTGTGATQISSGSQSCTAYSSELNAAYGFAWDNGITSFKDCRQANLEGPLFRSHMAKMIVQFAVKVLHKTPDTTKVCTFTDIEDQSPELQAYIKLACQLGLMGLKADGTVDNTFNPSQIVDRAQFGTMLSRLLRGEKYNGGNVYFTDHLQALKEFGIMTKIDTPFALELRGRVMLMMQRIFEKQ